MLVLGVLLVITAVLATLVIQDLQSEPGTIASVEVGECFHGEPDLSVVDCDQPHHGELFFKAPRATRRPPTGRGTLRDLVGQACVANLPTYFGVRPRPRGRGIEVSRWCPARTNGRRHPGRLRVAVPADGGTASGSIKGQGAG